MNGCKHLAHDLDLDRLVSEDVRSELINRIVLRSAVSLEKVVHHVDRTLMVLDHPQQEQAIELGPSCFIQFGHFIVSQHTGHQHVMFDTVHFHLHPRGRGVGHRQTSVSQPLLHRSDFIGLADNDPFAQNRNVGARTVRGRPAGHDDGLRVMRNHARHEGDVGIALLEPRVREFLKTYQQEPQVTIQPLFHVAVSGQVRTPNLFLVPPSSSVAQVIAMAGGPTDHGRMNRVRLVRTDTEVVLDLAHASPSSASMLVHSGDQVWVDPQLSVMRDYVFPAAGIISAAAFLTRVIVYKR